LILSAIVLGLMAGLQLLMAVFFLLAGILLPKAATQPQTGPIPAAGLVTVDAAGHLER